MISFLLSYGNYYEIYIQPEEENSFAVKIKRAAKNKQNISIDGQQIQTDHLGKFWEVEVDIKNLSDVQMQNWRDFLEWGLEGKDFNFYPTYPLSFIPLWQDFSYFSDCRIIEPSFDIEKFEGIAEHYNIHFKFQTARTDI